MSDDGEEQGVCGKAINGIMCCCLGIIAVPVCLFFIFKNEQNFVCTQKLLIEANADAREVTSCNTAESGFIAFSCDINTIKSYQTFGPDDFNFMNLTGALKKSQKLAPIEIKSLGVKQKVEYYQCIETSHKEGSKKNKNERTVYDYSLKWTETKSTTASFKDPNKANSICRTRAPIPPPQLPEGTTLGVKTKWASSLTAGAYSFDADYYTNREWRPDFSSVSPNRQNKMASETVVTVRRLERNVSLLAADQFCTTGTKKSGMCCDASCVKEDGQKVCGGADCGKLIGGSDKCCTGKIGTTCRPCDSPTDTGCVFDAAEDPKSCGGTTAAPTTTTQTTITTTQTTITTTAADLLCTTGTKKNGLCCDASCMKDGQKVCGGTGCNQLNGGASKCCTNDIAQICRICISPTDSGCVFDTKSCTSTPIPQTTTTTTKASDQFCTTGTKKNGLCCDAGCVKDGQKVCGGTGCNQLNGGASKCCTNDIAQICRICISPTDSGCVFDTKSCTSTPIPQTTTTTTSTKADGMRPYTPGAAFSNNTRLYTSGSYIQTCQSDSLGCVRIQYQQSTPTKVSAIGKTSANGRVGKQAMKPSWGCVSENWNVIFAKDISKKEIIDQLNGANDNQVMVLRVVLIICVWLGIFCCLYPVIAMADIMSDFLEYIPCVGDFLGGLVDGIAYCVVCCFSCSFGVSLSLFAISISWIVLRPLMGIGMMVVSICLCGAAGAVVQMAKKPKEGDDDLEMTQPEG